MIRSFSEHARACAGRHRSPYDNFVQEVNLALTIEQKEPVDGAIICGICAAGRILIVNTKQLSWFGGRSPTSIKHQLKELGCSTVATRTISERIVLRVLPCLRHNPALLRQHTVRIATDDCQTLCFRSPSRGPLNPAEYGLTEPSVDA
jgi:hypothetical protein